MPHDPDFYRQRAALVAEHGYTASTLASQAGTVSRPE
jgi:hypothetical protein